MKFLETSTPVPIKLDEIAFGSFRKRTTVGVNVIKKSIKEVKGKASDGLLRDKFMILRKIDRPVNQFKYECIDGNHRLQAFRDLRVAEWLCHVISKPITKQEIWVLASGKYKLDQCFSN